MIWDMRGPKGGMTNKGFAFKTRTRRTDRELDKRGITVSREKKESMVALKSF
jgi:hypothetical protein